ncbi:hypothetical protein F5984_03705 [Rudanella paleaurantiibacter]|uniref:DUF3575 domain-containing protein n=1 Tax=Rudanella paleaurantiibacter TaxID=2614655 RepID=A0A7J5U5K9_9BACT|nr:hypothetical protein [Rudanella paleaurantiibacter]KAB7733055.1 hypothetical protein F5984_03705 [Rudanella paleaurantiibacter]
MRAFILVGFGGLLLLTRPVWAQFPVTDSFDRPTERIDTVRVEGLRKAPGWVVKWNPLAMIDFDSRYQFDVERMVGRRYSIQGGVGYGNERIQIAKQVDNRFREREVWRTQLEGRLYTDRDLPQNRWRRVRTVTQTPLGNYLAINTFYKQVNAPFEGTLARGCDDGSCQFFERYSARAVRYVMGAHLKMGHQGSIQVSPNNNRLLLDVYAGIGIRWRWFRQFGIPNYEDARPEFIDADRDLTSEWSLQRGRFPSLMLGLQIGYTL